MTPNDFEAFYVSYKSYAEDNLNTELPNDSLKADIFHFKYPEVHYLCMHAVMVPFVCVCVYDRKYWPS